MQSNLPSPCRLAGVFAIAVALLLSACEQSPPPDISGTSEEKRPNNVYRQAIDEAKAVKQTIEQRDQKQ